MNRKYKKDVMDLVETLLELDCAPIKLSLRYVSNLGTVTDGIMISEAPPIVIDTLVRRNWTCSLMEDGILVYKL